MKKAIFAVIAVVIVALIATAYLTKEKPIEAIPSEQSPEIYTRPVYDKINSIIFADLPVPPKNFQLIRRNFYAGQIKDLSKIEQSVYKQPEFYPTWERNGILWFSQHDYTRWGVHGYGTFPSEMQYTVTNMSGGDNLDILTFIHTSWGIETWQGLKLGAIYNETLFEVKVSPDTILLEPTFPKMYNNWTQRIVLNITAKKDIPQGEYEFTLLISPPAEKQNEKWAWDVLERYTNNRYSAQISECREQITDICTTLTEMRQNKYVAGGMFSPSRSFKAVVIAE